MFIACDAQNARQLRPERDVSLLSPIKWAEEIIVAPVAINILYLRHKSKLLEPNVLHDRIVFRSLQMSRSWVSGGIVEEKSSYLAGSAGVSPAVSAKCNEHENRRAK